MKIATLLEIIQTDTSTRKYSGELKRVYDAENSAKMIGGGAYSNVKRNPKDPHTVVKNSRFPLDGVDYADGYEVYADYVVRKKLYENPHFPRIYIANKIVDKRGKHINKYEIESLIKAEELSQEDIDSVFETHFNASDYIRRNVYEMGHLLETCIRFGRCENVKLDSLLKACRTLKLIHRYHNRDNDRQRLYWDIREANIMFRRGPAGLTLVFTDPFS